MNPTPLRVTACALALLLLAGCNSASMTRSPRDEALYSYVSAVRWGDFDAALAFVDPEVLKAQPLSDVERERYRQFQVSGYEVRGSQQLSDVEYEQQVEIRLVNRHTQVERVITDRQTWRWDPEAKRWWLVSGLPKLDAER
jgi:hypothetical protein